MKITKELLEHLKLNSVSLEINNKNNLCFLERVEKDLWTFNLPEKIDLENDKELIFNITFANNITGQFIAKVSDYGENWINVKIHEDIENQNIRDFINAIYELEQKYENFGRRKEERIKIGREKSTEFGLSGLEQSIFLQGIKVVQPCVILDASVHGICIITPETPALRNEDVFCIKLHFENPVQTVILKAHCVYSKLNKTDSKTFITLCCQLLEPIHFVWKERVISMIDKSLS